MSDAMCALLFVERPSPQRPDINDALDAWQRIVSDTNKCAQTNATIEVLGESAFLLPLPDTLPILARCVAIAHQSGLRQRVRLFGPPVLTYAS